MDACGFLAPDRQALYRRIADRIWDVAGLDRILTGEQVVR